MRIDLHTHSDASDGTCSPADVVRAAATEGVAVLALTDHDTFAGLAEAAAQAPRSGVRLVRGVEISCTHGGISLHLLGYQPDETDTELLEELGRCRDHRVPRAQQMVARLVSDGLPIGWEQVEELAAGGTVGRPHIADALVRAGAVADREEAFGRYLRPDGPYYVRHYAVDAVTAVRLVRRCGGVPVFAHPGAHTRGPTVDDAAIEELAAAGLFGLEVDHPDHDEATRAHLRDVAGVLGLQVTGSSDFHGAGRPQRIGCETTSPDVLEALLAEAVPQPGRRS